jgi:hypothetical protein
VIGIRSQVNARAIAIDEVGRACVFALAERADFGDGAGDRAPATVERIPHRIDTVLAARGPPGGTSAGLCRHEGVQVHLATGTREQGAREAEPDPSNNHDWSLHHLANDVGVRSLGRTQPSEADEDPALHSFLTLREPPRDT